MFTALFAVACAVPWVSIATYDGALPFAIVFGALGEFTVISSGFRRVTIDDIGVAVHKLWFVTTSIPWREIESIEFPNRLGLWNSPMVRRVDGRTERMAPLTFGRLETRKAEVALQAVAKMRDSLAGYHSARPEGLG